MAAKRLAGWVLAAFATIGVAALVAVVVLTRTQVGQQLLLRRVLSRLESSVDGQLAVGGIHSPSVLGEVTLTAVGIRDARGRSLLSADSVRARYGFLSLLRGDFVIDEVSTWGAEVSLERLPGDQDWNVVKIFAPLLAPPAAPPGPDAGRIVFRDIHVHQADLTIRMPMDSVPAGRQGWRVESDSESSSPLRVLRFQEVESIVAELVVRAPDRSQPRLRIAELAFTADVWREPFRVERMRGDVEIGDSAVVLDIGELRLSGTRLGGRGSVGWGAGAGPSVTFDFEAPQLDLVDLRWVDPRVPAGKGGGAGRIEWTGAEFRFQAHRADLTLGTSHVAGALGVVVGRTPRLENIALDLDPLDLALLDRFLERPVPLRGALRGRVEANGPLASMNVAARLTLEAEGQAEVSAIDGAGTLHLDRPVGVTNLEVALEPLDLGILTGIAPVLRLRGPASARISASGRLADGLRVSALVAYAPGDLPPSRIEVEGSIRRGDGAEGLSLDLQANAQPLSFTALVPFYPKLPVRGEVRGPVRIRGDTHDLQVAADLETPAGRLAFQGRLDAHQPDRRYVVDGSVREFKLSEIVPKLSATMLTGSFHLDGSGLSLDSLRGTASAVFGSSTIEEVEVDTVLVALRAEDGLAIVDTALAISRAGTLSAKGRLALARTASPDAELHVTVAGDSLESLDAMLFGDSLIVQDTLSRIERRALELQGIDPDTLALAAGSRMGGRFRADFVLRGHVTDFSAEGRVELAHVHYNGESAGRVTADVRVEGLPALDGPAAAALRADSLLAYGRSFRQVHAQVEYTRPLGELALTLTRDAAEELRLTGNFQVDSTRLNLTLSEFSYAFADGAWTLDQPATVVRHEDGLEVRDFRLRGPPNNPMLVAASGVLASRGVADFRVDIGGLPLERVARLAQLEDHGIAGILDLEIDVAGTANAPVMRATVVGRDLRYQDISLSALDGTLQYEARRVTGRLEATNEGRMVFAALGTLPLDLALVATADRTPAEPVDIVLRADSLAVATVLSWLPALEEVRGSLTGEILVGGQTDSLAYAGEMRLAGGGARLDVLGVSYTDVAGTFRLTSDRLLHVDASLRSAGSARVAGTVRLDPVQDPGFELTMDLAGFEAVSRADMTALLAGRVALGGSYLRPVVTGSLQVESGVLFLQEFRRSRGVVDLSDPFLVSVVDTSLVVGQSFIAESQNPFLQNLRVDVNLGVRSDSWLRSPDMNVEIQGDLTVSYDRTAREIALGGELRAVRGSYSVFGRQFRVASGLIQFEGTPGVNPDLDIQASYRLRTTEGEPLVITATLGGSLLDPRLTLTSDAQPPISESDLVSYLIFGRPTYALAAGESSVLGRTISRSIMEAGGSTVLGVAASQLESFLVEDFGIDYFSIRPTSDAPGVAPGGERTSPLAGTQIELGQYIAQDVFLVLLYRLGTLSQSQFPGARLEWRFSDYWTAEMFAEDRFSREPLSGFGELGFRMAKIYGLLLYVDWGY